MSGDFEEIEAKLEILRQRAKAHQDFVAPDGQPPLLWQMAMLADAGFTVLPRVVDPDPDRSFPEAQIAMEPLDWSDEHYCLVGGYRFEVMRVPRSYGGHLMRPKPSRAYYSVLPAELPPISSYEVEHFQRREMALAFHGRARWRSRIMVCIRSRAEALMRERCA